MAVLTQNELEDILWRATVIVLGLNPDSQDEAVQKRVRISWPENESTTWGRNENVVFLRILPSPDEFTTLKDISHVYDAASDVLSERVEYHRRFTVNWVCYGPDALDDADTIRIGILREPIRDMLRESLISFIPHIREPVRLDELDQSGDWWRRYDVSADFYNLASREYSEEYIVLPPDTPIIKNR